MERVDERQPWAILLLGLLTAVSGAAWLILAPSSRFKGATPLAIAQGVVVFGGIAAMLLGLALLDTQTRDERAAKLRESVRNGLVFVAILAILFVYRVPAAVFIAGMGTALLGERFRRLCAWLGRA